ncbi:MAG TPA: phage holin family protein [Acidimicrobiales bacterium]|jgi:membrane protein|nr:phage holin family protein [Acidimicrobiales bacterium]
MEADSKSVSDLLKELANEMTTLIHEEMALAKSEMSVKAKKTAVGAGLFGGAGAVALFGVGALVAAAIAGLATAISVWLSALIVGGVLLAVAGVVALVAARQTSDGAPPVPEQAIESTKEDVQWLKTQAKSARR